jgi:hypothetical protein
VSVQPEIAEAREDVQRARNNISTTVAELEERITAPVQAVKRRLDVGQVVQEHPWAALAVAVGTGALVAGSGADRRAAAATAAKARQGGAAALRATRQGATSARGAASSAPSRSRGVVVAAVDSLSAKLATTLFEALRTPRVAPLSPEPNAGLGFVANPAPPDESGVHESASPE